MRLLGVGVLAWMTVYLVHGFVVRGLEYADLWDALPGPGPVEMLQVIAIGVLITCALGAPPVASRLEWLVDPVRTGQAWWRRASRQEAAAPATPDPPGPRVGGPHVGRTAERGTDSSEEAPARSGA